MIQETDSKAPALATFVRRLLAGHRISRSRAINAPDRLAWRLEEKFNDSDTAEAVSVLYMLYCRGFCMKTDGPVHWTVQPFTTAL